MVEKYIGFSVAVSNVWLGSAYDKKFPKMVIIAKERCNPKLMSRVMADVPFSTTCVFRYWEQRQQLWHSLLWVSQLRECVPTYLYARELLSALLTSTLSASTIRMYIL